MPSLRNNLTKHAFNGVRTSQDLWHYRLGHPSPLIIQQVLQANKLPVLPNNNYTSVCNACQQAKSHQLPFPCSTSTSSPPLKLVFSDA